MDITPEAICCYEAAGAAVKKARQSIGPAIKEGVKILDIAVLIEQLIRDEGAAPAFPCNVGVNKVASHYTPAADDERVINRGDIVKVDLGASVDGYVADIAFTVEVGTHEQAGLIDAAEMALSAGLARIRPGVRVGEVGAPSRMRRPPVDIT
jgi:methionyl aminopeptidase